MQLSELFTDEDLEEDIRKTFGAAALGGALLATPVSQMGHSDTVKQGPATRDIAILAQTIWGEARGHGATGMNAVGHVIKNRVDAKRNLFGQGLTGVIKKDKQFSCWNAGDPNRDKMQDMLQLANAIRDQKAPDGQDFGTWYSGFKKTGLYKEYATWAQAYKIARNILDGNSSDPTNGAVYYHTTAVHPYWADKMDPVSQVANHLFYKLPQK